MKDWEINKVNELFRRIDTLQDENDRLKKSGADQLVNLLKSMEDHLECLSGRLDTVSGNVDDMLVKLEEVKCKCVEAKPTRQYNKKSK
jgi:seryl-tRNA synthetase